MLLRWAVPFDARQLMAWAGFEPSRRSALYLGAKPLDYRGFDEFSLKPLNDVNVSGKSRKNVRSRARLHLGGYGAGMISAQRQLILVVRLAVMMWTLPPMTSHRFLSDCTV